MDWRGNPSLTCNQLWFRISTRYGPQPLPGIISEHKARIKPWVPLVVDKPPKIFFKKIYSHKLKLLLSESTDSVHKMNKSLISLPKFNFIVLTCILDPMFPLSQWRLLIKKIQKHQRGLDTFYPKLSFYYDLFIIALQSEVLLI